MVTVYIDIRHIRVFAQLVSREFAVQPASQYVVAVCVGIWNRRGGGRARFLILRQVFQGGGEGSGELCVVDRLEQIIVSAETRCV